ncbi:MAG: serine/threonine-protein kinase, partial [Ktedonobacteraceae bacterium]
GQLVDMNTKSSDTAVSIRTFVNSQIAPAPLQTANTNALHDAWKSGISDFYTNHLASAQTEFRNAAKPNPLFLAPGAFLKLPAFQGNIGTSGSGRNGTPTAGRGASYGEQSTNLFGITIPNSQLMWLVIGGVVLLVLLSLLLSLTLIRRQAQRRRERELARFEQEQRAADQKADIAAERAHHLARFEQEQRAANQKAARDAARIAEQQKAERQRAQPGQQQESSKTNNAGISDVLPGANRPPVASPPPVQPTVPVVNTTPALQVPQSPDQLCPNCHHSVPSGAAFCANCGYSLSPLREARTVVVSLPAVEEQKPVPVSPPESLLPVQPALEVGEGPVWDEIDKDEEVPNRVGQRLGNYQLIRLLGEGGFAEVYLGEHIHLGSYAAIKVLHSQLSSAEREKFRLEARTLVHLVHPHIVRVLDFGLEGKIPFLVMDYAPNGTLRQRHPKGKRLPLTTIISYVRQVAEALQFAHDQKLIHRDIKPENILVGQRNEVLLSDFGIAIVTQSSRYKNVQDMAGTIAYMAPEQIQAHPRPASDQYALGIVVYEWLCGERPFHGAFTEIAIKHAVVPPPSLCEKVPLLSPAVEEVVLRALAKDPKERFGRILAFADALERAR